MTDQQDRDRESEQTNETLYERNVDEEAQRRAQAAERLRDDPALTPPTSRRTQPQARSSRSYVTTRPSPR